MRPIAVLQFALALAVFAIPAAGAAVVAKRLAASSRDHWTLLAWVPVLPLAIWAPYIAWDVTRDRTSHNLWPFELVIWAMLSGALFGAFLLTRRLFGGSARDHTN